MYNVALKLLNEIPHNPFHCIWRLFHSRNPNTTIILSGSCVWNINNYMRSQLTVILLTRFVGS